MRRLQSIMAVLGVALALALTGAPSAQADPGQSNGDGTVSPAIIGGVEATRAYSFMVSIQDAETHFCGGSLISSSWVVTALHCVVNHTPEELKLRIGSLRWQSGGQERGVEQIVLYPGGTPEAHDLALIELDQPVFNAPIRIGTRPADGTTTRLIGWGCTSPGAFCSPPDVLQQLNSTLRPATDCDSASTPIDPAIEVCTGNPATQAGPCRGDSGGPLLVPGINTWRLLGAFSRMNDLFCQDGKGVYTDVAAHRTWIESVTGPLP
ncbi:S1 family peptidase [Streptosporangium carneum]|uniref:Serine protease n=1 Tax=Streptosporangium carneum TaxID=47481 RepID=A0A9W6HZY9_9ACTN|nr:serine protease [Streptosporangium carneum]GLK08901.1 serine protease [Streptosporangium carneum]